VCGIIGICRAEPVSEKERHEVEQGADWMRLRGPDGSGFIARDGIYFGHRRLAILDLEGGKQPWVDRESGNVLVFNGELFNFRELRSKLLAKGAVLRTNSDTELLMAAYLIWGRGCLEHFNGMFAFALYDPSDRNCWLVRDRLGVKPLYYHFDKKSLRFASSMKGIFAFSGIERRIDIAAAAHYFRTIRTTLGRRTLVDGVYSLGAGETLLWRADDMFEPKPLSYWNLFELSLSEKVRQPTFAEACAETRERVQAAVELQMISDVPLGGFLSGGLDSSILACEASSVLGGQLGTFSVGYEQEGYQEWDAIRESVNYHQLVNEEIHLQPDDYPGDWRWLIAEKGQPLSTPNEVSIYRLARAFERRYKVALSGEGADEVFGGYIIPTFCAFDWDRFVLGAGLMEPNCFKKTYGTEQPGTRQEHFFRINSWISRERMALIFDSAFLPEQLNDPVDDHYRELFARTTSDSTFGAYMKIHACVNLEGLLARLDTSTMAASVEGRVPFTDHHLVEWLFSLPDSYKMLLRPGYNPEVIKHQSVYEIDCEGLVESKRLLRGAYSKNIPDVILRRRKVSFPVPLTELFRGPCYELYLAAMDVAGEPARLLRPDLRRGLWSKQVIDPMLAWPMVNLFLWQKEFGISFSS
jgi:asparagine synthase (glutamine-hydrolysing)